MTNILLSIALVAVGGGAFIAGSLLLDQSLNYEMQQHVKTYIG